MGENKEITTITHDNYIYNIDRDSNSTVHTYTLLKDGNYYTANILTVKNSAGLTGRAVALNVESGRSMFKNCRYLHHQNMRYAASEGSRQYFEDRYIKSSTYFIFDGEAVVNDNCFIQSKSNFSITAQASPEEINP